MFTLAFPVLTAVVLGEAFGNSPQEDTEHVFRGMGAMDYYLPAYVALAISALGLVSIPVHLAGYRDKGILRRFRASGISAGSLLGAQVGVMIVMSAAGTVLLLAVGYSMYEVRSPASIGGVLLAHLVCVVIFACIRVMLGAVIPSARAAQGVGLFLFLVMMFLARTGPPWKVLGGLMERVGDFLPLTHAAVALQDPWNGLGTNAAELGVMAAFAVATALIALRTFRWD